MRLEEDEQPATRRDEPACRGDRRGNLGRVVSVVVVDANPAALADSLQAPPDPAELAEDAEGSLLVDARSDERGEGARRVRAVVLSGNAEHERVAERPRPRP